MITRKELGFINKWANKVPYPGIDYCEKTLDKLIESLALYHKEYANIQYNISFSNNEEIEFEILQKNICHMLGINYKNLSSDYFKNYRKDVLDYDPEKNISSYELLKLIIENKQKVLDYDQKYVKAINYYKIAIKCDIFSKLSDLSAFNYGCINFNKDEYLLQNPNDIFNSNSTKFFYTPSDEIVSPYFMMGLRATETDTVPHDVEDEEAEIKQEQKSYIVETLIAPEAADRLFRNQDVIIPTQILTDIKGTLVKKEATQSDKIKLLKEYQSIINQYDMQSKINIYGDYLSLLMSQEREKIKQMKNR
ncbi:MAG: hypothetical protein PHN72_00550 [Bacilli bacterium]|nr:hypothetical protein [Bacilli bacterium]